MGQEIYGIVEKSHKFPARNPVTWPYKVTGGGLINERFFPTTYTGCVCALPDVYSDITCIMRRSWAGGRKGGGGWWPISREG